MDATLDDMTRALNAVKAIDVAAADVNRQHPLLCTMPVAWDHDDPGVAAMLRDNPVEYRLLTGEREYFGHDIELAVRVGRDDDGVLDNVDILAVLNEPLALPPDPGELCEALACCLEHSVIPVLAHDEDTDSIIAHRVTVNVPIESLSGRILRDALDRLNKAAVLLRTYLSQDNGDEQRPIDGPIA